ncbi:MAG: serine hydrolase [Bacteriovoracaceae bacterium]
MLTKLQDAAIPLLHQSDFDYLAVGTIDFELKKFESFQIAPNEQGKFGNDFAYFDLASMTKPLVLASTYLAHPEWFSEKEMLLLNHEGGVPSWGRISETDWRNYLKQFPITSSDTLYSDYSALRLMIELEEKQKIDLKTEAQKMWDPEVVFWKDLPRNSLCPPTGFREGEEIRGAVHDPNAYVINEFCSHAGLFGTIQGVCRTFLKLDEKCQMIEKLKNEYRKNQNLKRFILGWDRVTDPENTLAGKGAGPMTFGHLGFTGTSVWIDAEKKKGIVILSNSTKLYWYNKDSINSIRRTLGSLFWNEK